MNGEIDLAGRWFADGDPALAEELHGNWHPAMSCPARPSRPSHAVGI
jgi:hypothetical protein